MWCLYLEYKSCGGSLCDGGVNWDETGESGEMAPPKNQIRV